MGAVSGQGHTATVRGAHRPARAEHGSVAHLGEDGRGAGRGQTPHAAVGF